MKRVFSAATAFLSLCVLLATGGVAFAKSTFVVMPFSIQGPAEFAYLERSIPQMLTSRLFWDGEVESAVQDMPASVKPVTSANDAAQARTRYKADYVVWGTVTVMGDDCSLDVRVTDKSGKVRPFPRDTKAPQLIAAIRDVSDAINAEVFNRTQQPSWNNSAGAVNQMNPNVMINETSGRDVYLNPQFRYADGGRGDDARLRSQALPFASVGMEVVDANGDGKNEILLLAKTTLYAYRLNNGKLDLVAEFQFPRTQECLTIRSISRATGKPWIIVNMVDKNTVPKTSILTLDGNAFKEEMRNIKYFLNVVKLPPHFTPILIGQQTRPPRLFQSGTVYEMIKQGDQLVPGKGVSLPRGTNLLNFAYLPGNRDERGGEKAVVLSGTETLRVYNDKQSRLAETPEKYSGSAVGFEVTAALRGMSDDGITIGESYYVPMRMIPTDLDRDGSFELLVNKPISTASQIFDRYRFFPQSEIHSLFWDGVGLNLQWKTRRIVGSVADFTIADANNDGTMDLVTCVNTHPGALGAKARKTVVVLYPLDLSQNRATRADFD